MGKRSQLLARGSGPLQPPGWWRARRGAAEAQALPGGRPGPRPGLCQAGWVPAPPLRLLGPKESEPALDLPRKRDLGWDHLHPLGPASCPLDSSAGREERGRGVTQLHVGRGGHKELQGPRTAHSNFRLRVLAGSAPPQSRRPGSWESRGMRPREASPCVEQRPAHPKGSSGVQAPHGTVHSTLDQVMYTRGVHDSSIKSHLNLKNGERIMFEMMKECFLLLFFRNLQFVFNKHFLVWGLETHTS